MKYTLIDYYTGKEISEHKTEKEVIKAKQNYLYERMRDKVIHNNLLFIKISNS